MIKYLIATGLMAAFWTFLVAGCNQLVAPEMKLDVDSSLLDMHEQHAALNISYGVPQGFRKLSETDTPAHYKQLLCQRADGITANRLYLDTISGSLMSLSEISQEKWEQHERFLEKAHTSPLALEWNFVNATAFKYNTFQVQQWLLQDYEWINFRMLFRRGASFFQVDYFIPTSHFNHEVDKLIASSIGSFNTH